MYILELLRTTGAFVKGAQTHLVVELDGSFTVLGRCERTKNYTITLYHGVDERGAVEAFIG